VRKFLQFLTTSSRNTPCSGRKLIVFRRASVLQRLSWTAGIQDSGCTGFKMKGSWVAAAIA
jgi:hypothetical protein